MYFKEKFKWRKKKIRVPPPKLDKTPENKNCQTLVGRFCPLMLLIAIYLQKLLNNNKFSTPIYP